MKCACVTVETDGETPDFYSMKIRTARTAHKCNECRRTIDSGEKYESVSGKWDGRFETYKTCSDCLSIRGEFFCNSWNFGDVKNDLIDHIWDADGEVSESCVASLTPRARDMVCKIIEDCWESTDDDDDDE